MDSFAADRLRRIVKSSHGRRRWHRTVIGIAVSVYAWVLWEGKEPAGTVDPSRCLYTTLFQSRFPFHLNAWGSIRKWRGDRALHRCQIVR
jgi:hypothetical protein